MDTQRTVGADSALGATPYLNAALTNSLVAVCAPPAGSPRPRVLYAFQIYNASNALAFVQVFNPTVVGTTPGVTALGSAGAQTGIVVTLTKGSLSNGDKIVIDTGAQSEMVTITALSGTGPYTIGFTTSNTHPTSGTIAILGGVVLGTTAPGQSYGVPTVLSHSLSLADVGMRFDNGILLAATTAVKGSSAPSSGLVVNLSYA